MADDVTYTAVYALDIIHLIKLIKVMLNLIAAISYFVVLAVSIWAASAYESQLASVRKTWKLS